MLATAPSFALATLEMLFHCPQESKHRAALLPAAVQKVIKLPGVAVSTFHSSQSRSFSNHKDKRKTGELCYCAAGLRGCGCRRAARILWCLQVPAGQEVQQSVTGFTGTRLVAMGLAACFCGVTLAEVAVCSKVISLSHPYHPLVISVLPTGCSLVIFNLLGCK